MNNTSPKCCEYCAYFYYDEDYECYMCDMDLDEDEVARFYANQTVSCPYFRDGDEYKTVRKQN